MQCTLYKKIFFNMGRAQAKADLTSPQSITVHTVFDDDMYVLDALLGSISREAIYI